MEMKLMNEKILFTDEMKFLDQYTCEKRKISSLELMEMAGKNVYECLKTNCPIDKTKDNILVVAGLGNNGGDALVVSEHLLKDKYQTNIVIIGKLSSLTEEARAVYERLINKQYSIINITSNNDLKLFNRLANEAKVIV